MKDYFIQARDKAVKAGYDYAYIEPQDSYSAYRDKVLLDKNFWVALGKSLEWGQGVFFYNNFIDGKENNDGWRIYWHRFIDTLAEGKTPEEFFKELLKDERN